MFYGLTRGRFDAAEALISIFRAGFARFFALSAVGVHSVAVEAKDTLVHTGVSIEEGEF